MRDLDRWFSRMVLAVAVAVCSMAVGAFAAMPIMGKRIFVPLGVRVSLWADSSVDFLASSRLKREG